MQYTSTTKAPAPAGHYSQAVVFKDLVFVSGQLPINPENGDKITGSIEDQSRQALQNVKAIVEAAGSDLNHVLKVTVYISDVSLWAAFNAVYSDFFGEHKPARAVVPTRDLHYGFNVEIEAIAAVV